MTVLRWRLKTSFLTLKSKSCWNIRIDWKKEEVSHLICVTVHRHVHVEQKGIVFLDEIVLMLVPKVYSYREICCPLSKEPPFLQNFGNILFIASGSFHSVKPNDMLTSGIK